MLRTVVAVSACIPLLACAGPAVEAGDAETCLAQFESPAELPEGELSACADLLRPEVGGADDRVGKRLLGVVRNDRAQIRTRIVALELLCEKAGSDLAPQVVALAATWADNLDHTQRDAAEFVNDERAQAQSGLLATFGRNVKGMQGRLVDQEPLLTVLEHIYMRAWCGMDAKAACLEAIAGSPAPIELRRRHALAIIAESRSNTEAPDCLLRLLGRETFPELRKLVRTGKRWDDFQFMAAAVLAYFGDQEILPDLEAARPALRAKHVNFEKYVANYIWQINAQNPPGKLLESIATSESPMHTPRQMWAIRRAVEVGLKPEDIRAAIFEYAKKVEPEASRRDNGTVATYWPGLSTLKKEALELGVLRPDDLPEVEIPKVQPTP